MSRTHANGIDMYYEIHGAGEPLVLIGGISSDHNNWVPHVEVLKSRFRCLIFDNRGMGQTDRPDMEYTTRLFAQDTAQLMEATGFGQAHVVGLSMGACIAQELCLGYPDKVLSMMLVSGWARADNFFSELFNLWIWLAENAGLTTPWRYGLLWSFSARMFNERPQEVQKILDDVCRAGISFPAFVRQARSLLTHSALDRLHAVKVPTLVLVGTEDILTPYRLSEELHRAIPGSRLKVLQGQAHAFPLEEPQLFIQEILDFIPAGASV